MAMEAELAALREQLIAAVASQDFAQAALLKPQVEALQVLLGRTMGRFDGLVCCHNDLDPANIIVAEEEGGGGQRQRANSKKHRDARGPNAGRTKHRWHSTTLQSEPA
jgi:thiamine kinase-like enzyme